MNATELPELLIEFLSKSALALAAGFLLIALLRKLSPSWKHGVWLRIFLASLAIPLLLLLPRWEWIPNMQREVTPVVEIAPATSRVTSIAAEVVSEPAPAVAPVNQFRFSLPWTVFAIWSAGALVLLLRSVIAGIYLRRIAKQARSASPRIMGKFQTVYQSMQIKRPVSLIVSSSIASPFTWGLRRPRIVLPESAESWSDTDLKMILLHELEHVKRRDAFAVLISRAFLVLNWVNPIAWLALRQTVRFREEACDSRVLRAGHDSETYAEMLFRQARTASAPFLQTCATAVAATAVAETGTIEKRIQVILSPRSKNHPPHRTSLLARTTSIVLFSSILILGMAGCQKSAPEEAEKTEPEEMEVTEPKEVKVAEPDAKSAEAILAKEQALKHDLAVMEEKLKTIILPSIEFRDTPLADALKFLQQKSVELDATTTDRSEKGINIVMHSSVGKRGEDMKITMKLTNVPLGDALRYTVSLANLKYKVEPHAVVITDGSMKNPNLYTNAYVVPPRFLMPKAADGSVPGRVKTAKEVLEMAGVEFGEGGSAIFNPATSQLIVRNTQDQIELIEAYIESLETGKRGDLLKEVAKRWEKPLKKENEKMKSITLPKVEFADMPFPDAIRFLQQRSVELDPEKKGFNIILDGQPRVGDIRSIKITMRLSNVPFAEALRYTCNLAQFEYVVEPNAIVIRPIERRE